MELSNIVHNNKYDYSKVNYKTAHDYVTIICPKHGEFLQKPYSHLNKRGCPSCNESQGEKLITTLLRKHNLPHVRQKRFSDCVNIHGVKRCLQLPFDFYLPNSNSCIEYDGEQHFFPVLSFGGEKAFAETKLRDELKNKYCQEKGINLIRIPYTMKKEDIEPFILKELGI